MAAAQSGIHPLFYFILFYLYSESASDAGGAYLSTGLFVTSEKKQSSLNSLKCNDIAPSSGKRLSLQLYPEAILFPCGYKRLLVDVFL